MNLERLRFRAKTTDGSWLYGIPHKTPLGNWMMRDEQGSGHYIDSDTICQFTGLKDKDGIEIYEGDLLSTDLSKPFCEVVFRNGCFALCLNDGGNDFYDIFSPLEDNVTQTKYHEVIGNKFDNPNLLTKEQ